MEMETAALHAQINAGLRASRELELTRALFAEIKENAAERVMTSNVEAKINNERLIVTYQMVDAVQTALERLVDGGEGAKLVLASLIDGLE